MLEEGFRVFFVKRIRVFVRVREKLGFDSTFLEEVEVFGKREEIFQPLACTVL